MRSGRRLDRKQGRKKAAPVCAVRRAKKQSHSVRATSDSSTKQGRANEVALLGNWLVTFWSDHAVKGDPALSTWSELRIELPQRD